MADNSLTLTLVGGPTVIIDVLGYRLITDPTFDPPGDYPSGAITLSKTRGPAIAADAAGKFDAVLLSHDQHADNLDRAGRALLAAAPVTFTTEVGAQRLGGTARGLAPFAHQILEPPAKADRLVVTATPARHGPVGIEPISGDVVGFVVGGERAGDLVYVTGDTVWYEGTAEVARRYSPRIVIVFAGSAEPRGTFHMTMNTNDVIATAHAFPTAQIVAVHNDGWGHFKESAEQLAAAFATLGLASRLTTLEPGRPTRLTLSPASCEPRARRRAGTARI